jgi:glutathione synthase/RimK-type ligase-like ATP-grasp enzyme
MSSTCRPIILFCEPFFDWNKQFAQIGEIHSLSELIKYQGPPVVPCTMSQIKYLIDHQIPNALCPRLYTNSIILDNKCSFTKFMKTHLEHLIPTIYEIQMYPENEAINPYKFPCIFKLAIACGGVDSAIAQNPEELKQVKKSKKTASYIVQEYIKGHDELSANIYIRNGIIKKIICYKSAHMSDIYIQRGKAFKYTRIEYDPEPFAKLFRLLDYTGIVDIDFKETATGPKIFEINPRLGGTLVDDSNDFKEFMNFIADDYNKN